MTSLEALFMERARVLEAHVELEAEARRRDIANAAYQHKLIQQAVAIAEAQATIAADMAALRNQEHRFANRQADVELVLRLREERVSVREADVSAAERKFG